MNDDEIENGGQFHLAFQFALPGRRMDEDDSGTDDDDDDSGTGDSDYRLILGADTSWDNYRMHMELSESRAFRGHAYSLTINAKQKLDERMCFTGVEAVDRTIHSYIPESEPIGILKALVALRPHEEFDVLMECYEMESILRTFCNPYGIAKKCRNPLLRDDRNAVEKGSIIIFETLEVHPDHTGKDMGLGLIHKALEFLDYAASIEMGDAVLDDYAKFTPNENFRWSLALFNFTAGKLSEQAYVFPDSRTLHGSTQEDVFIGDSAAAKRKEAAAKRRREAAVEKVCRHFARFGFRQAGHNITEYEDWFLTRAMRDSIIASSSSKRTSPGMRDNRNNTSRKRKQSGDPVATQQNEVVPTTRLWLEKSETASLEVYHYPSETPTVTDYLFELEETKHEGLRGQLVECLEEFLCSKLQAEDTLHMNHVRFNRLIAETKYKEKEAKKYPVVNEIQISIESALEKSRSEIQEAAERQLKALSQRFLHRKLPALLEKCKKSESTSASIINDMFALHRVLNAFVSSKRRLPYCNVADFVDCLKLLVKFGADVNLRDVEYGNTPLHKVQELFNLRGYREVVEYLLSVGADPTILSGKNIRPAELLMEEFDLLLVNKSNRNCSFEEQEALIVRAIEDVNTLMPAAERDLLVDGWLSPRMSLVLSKKASELYVGGNELINQVHRSQQVPYAVLRGSKAFEYIPSSIRESVNQRGVSKKFLRGWCLVFQAADYILTNEEFNKSTPSTQNISELIGKMPICGSMGLSEQRSDFQFYLGKGGRVEFALDALISLATKEFHADGKRSGIWSHRHPDALVQKLPATPFDYNFALPLCMLVSKGGGQWLPYGHGPFPES